jgi:hypothetical protein
LRKEKPRKMIAVINILTIFANENTDYTDSTDLLHRVPRARVPYDYLYITLIYLLTLQKKLSL